MMAVGDDQDKAQSIVRNISLTSQQLKSWCLLFSIQKKAPPITWSCFANPAKYPMWSSPKHRARMVVRIPMQLILGNQRAAISS